MNITDASIYDAMVRLAQPWKGNIPLMDHQGNIGSVHGDNPAAQRYVEMRSSSICEFAFKDLKKETVQWSPTYDSSDVEPVLMPFHFPNLLINAERNGWDWRRNGDCTCARFYIRP